MDKQKKIAKIVRDSLQEVAQSIADYHKEEHEFFQHEEFTVTSLFEEYDECEKVRTKTISEFKKRFSLEDEILGLLLYLHTELLLLLGERINLNKVDPLQLGVDSHSYTSIRTFTWILTNQFNTLLSIRRMLRDGMDLQAKVLLRTYIEHADLGIAMLSDEKFYNDFAVGVDLEEAQKHWYKNYHPSKAEARLQQFYNELDPSGEIWDIVSQIRTPAYEILSAYAHAGYIPILMSACFEDSKGRIGTSFGGKTSTWMQTTIRNAILYPLIFISYAMASLVKDHKLPFAKFGDDGLRYVFTFTIIERLTKTFAVSLWAESESMAEEDEVAS